MCDLPGRSGEVVVDADAYRQMCEAAVIGEAIEIVSVAEVIAVAEAIAAAEVISPAEMRWLLLETEEEP